MNILDRNAYTIVVYNMDISIKWVHGAFESKEEAEEYINSGVALWMGYGGYKAISELPHKIVPLIMQG